MAAKTHSMTSLAALIVMLLLSTILVGPVEAVKGEKRSVFANNEQLRRQTAEDETTGDQRKKNKSKEQKCDDSDEDPDLRDTKGYDYIDCSPSSVPTVYVEPTAAPVVAPTQAPLALPTPAPLQDAPLADACQVAAQGGIFQTSRSISVPYVYELVTYIDSDLDDVVFNVDKAVQRFMLDRLVDCDNRRRHLKGRRILTAVGVSPGNPDRLIDQGCTNLFSPDPTIAVCHVMEGSLVLYLDQTSTWTNEEGAWIVYELLSNAYNGESRPLQDSSFVDPNRGILDLYFVHGLIDTTGEDPVSVEEVENPPASQGMSAMTIALIVAVSVLVVLSGLLFVMHKRKSSHLAREGCKEKDDEDTMGTLHAVSTDELEDDLCTRTCFGGLAAHVDDQDMEVTRQPGPEQILRDLGSMSLAQTLSNENFADPFFVSTDSSVLTPSKYPKRTYVISDTIQF